MNGKHHSHPVISVLSSVYNEEDNLEAMLRSLREQSFKNWELVVIDDSSTDATPTILRQAATDDSRIRVVSEGVKLGKVGAFNLAFQESRGDLIALMAGDDTMPIDSLASRVAALPEPLRVTSAVAYFKLRTMSDTARFDGQVLPRGSRGSRSGPSITITRPLAERCFPVPESLPSEDSWLGEMTEILAEHVVERSDIAVNYRIHEGNSNPRHKSFDAMSEAMHRRSEAWKLMLGTRADDLPKHARSRLETLRAVEEHRYHRRLFRILRQQDMPIIDRLANISMASPALFRLRSRFYLAFSGWRGR
jgi:glycosyltransferase involved in cell wall biosynthesis